MERILISAIIMLFGITPLQKSWATTKQTLRILHVMSYHQEWQWNIDQLQGFKDGLGELDVEYKIVELDTINTKDPRQIQTKVDIAKQLIKNWQPHLLYSNDDNAQSLLTADYVNTSLPIVFSAVKRNPAEYGFHHASNVTGVMEHELFIPSINLLRNIVGDVKRIAVFIGNDPTWQEVKSRMQASINKNDQLEVSEWILIEDYAHYQKKILAIQDKVDAIASLGRLSLKDNAGNHVPYQEVMKWTIKHSQLPDFSFWESHVNSGTLCAVAVSGYEQGLIAGEMAKRILIDKISPTQIDIQSSYKGEPMINIARAKALGITIDVQILLNNTIKNNYQWDTP